MRADFFFTNETGQSTHWLPIYRTYIETEKIVGGWDWFACCILVQERKRKEKKRFLTDYLECKCTSMQRIFQANRALQLECKISNPKNLQKRFHSHFESQEVWIEGDFSALILNSKFKILTSFSCKSSLEVFSAISYLVKAFKIR
jgi:hypothetical protein